MMTSKRSADEDSAGDSARKRQALSCSQCKRRKIRCDRRVRNGQSSMLGEAYVTSTTGTM